MKIESLSRDATLNIDLGQISEDIIPNHKLDTEDWDLNDVVDPGEDTGIDGIPDSLESGNLIDAGNDNYSFELSRRNYEKINGMEGNAISIEAGKLPDSEDLNRDGFLDQRNNFFTYSFSLGSRDRNWRKIVIGLLQYDSKIGNPDFDVMEYLRLWISNSSGSVHLRFAEINFTEY